MEKYTLWGLFWEVVKIFGFGALLLEGLKFLLARRTARDAENVQVAIKQIDEGGELRGDLKSLWETCCSDLADCRAGRERDRTAHALALAAIEGIYTKLILIAQFRDKQQTGWEFGLAELEVQATKGLPDVQQALHTMRATTNKSSPHRDEGGCMHTETCNN